MEVAAKQAELGDFVAALATTRQIAVKRRRTSPLIEIAIAQYQSGDDIGAYDTADFIEDSWDHMVYLLNIYRAQSTVGDETGMTQSIQKAYLSIDTVKDAETRCDMLGSGPIKGIPKAGLA